LNNELNDDFDIDVRPLAGQVSIVKNVNESRWGLDTRRLSEDKIINGEVVRAYA